MIRTPWVAVALSVGLVATAAACGKPADTTALEKKLHGGWKGGACVGTLTFAADGTFTRTHYTPGGNTITGTWVLKWDALPPTLVMTTTTSDAPDRLKVGEVTAVKLVELSAGAMAYRSETGEPVRFERVNK
jgi:hypothetical protein